MTKTGRCQHSFRSGQCGDDGWEEYCGYCSECWLRLDDDERAALLEQRVSQAPPAPITNNYTQTYPANNSYYPPQSRIVTFIVVLAATLAAFGLAKLLHLH